MTKFPQVKSFECLRRLRVAPHNVIRQRLDIRVEGISLSCVGRRKGLDWGGLRGFKIVDQLGESLVALAERVVGEALFSAGDGCGEETCGGVLLWLKVTIVFDDQLPIVHKQVSLRCLQLLVTSSLLDQFENLMLA